MTSLWNRTGLVDGDMMFPVLLDASGYAPQVPDALIYFWMVCVVGTWQWRLVEPILSPE
jgi:hypothetical protein